MPNGTEGVPPAQSPDDDFAKKLEGEFEKLGVAEEVVAQMLDDLKKSGLFGGKYPVTLENLTEYFEKWFEAAGMDLERQAAGVTEVVGIVGAGGHHGRWSSADDRVLMSMVQDYDIDAIATRLGRTARAVKEHMKDDLGL